MIIQTYYISTGALNAMYTLRVSRADSKIGVCMDHYICNLAGANNLDYAEKKAQDYFDRIKDRIGETEDFKLLLDLDPEYIPGSRRGRLSARDTRLLETIEQGRFPFGKYESQLITDAPDHYILFFADKKDLTYNVVTQALSYACMGIALERGLIAKRDVAKQERRERDLKSNHVGEIGQRLELEGELVTVWLKQTEYDEYHINKIRVGDNLFMYYGKKLGERGDMIKIKATVKDHTVWDDVKSTKINRPTIIKD